MQMGRPIDRVLRHLCYNTEKLPMKDKIEIIQGDITKQHVDAVVNAANTKLLGGGGVDGAIHRAAGPELLEECRTLGGCPTGEAKITKGYELPAKWVIHTVGPVWNDGNRNEAKLLASCYQNCFQLVEEHQIRTVAFPSVSAGVYRFPIEKASRIALSQTKEFLEKSPSYLQKIIFVCFGDDVFQHYQEGFQEIFNCSG